MRGALCVRRSALLPAVAGRYFSTSSLLLLCFSTCCWFARWGFVRALLVGLIILFFCSGSDNRLFRSTFYIWQTYIAITMNKKGGHSHGNNVESPLFTSWRGEMTNLTGEFILQADVGIKGVYYSIEGLKMLSNETEERTGTKLNIHQQLRGIRSRLNELIRLTEKGEQ